MLKWDSLKANIEELLSTNLANVVIKKYGNTTTQK